MRGTACGGERRLRLRPSGSRSPCPRDDRTRGIASARPRSPDGPQDVVAHPAYPPRCGRSTLRHNSRMPSQGELILRLLLAATLAGVLGVERELTEQPAGFRTHILVGLGAALFTIVSAYGFQSIAGLGPRLTANADVTRVASQLVVGIGFLGGGAILKYGASV